MRNDGTHVGCDSVLRDLIDLSRDDAILRHLVNLLGVT